MGVAGKYAGRGLAAGRDLHTPPLRRLREHRRMKDLADIDAELARLERRLPGLIAERGEKAGVLEAFSAEAEPLTRGLPAEHEAYVNSRLNCMLAAAGLVPGEPEGEPCPTGIDAADPHTPRTPQAAEDDA